MHATPVVLQTAPHDEASRNLLQYASGDLSAELVVLHRLRDSYEQKTFDTRGPPHTDVLAFLLSSLKDVVNVNVKLVHRIHAQERQWQQQQAAYRELRSEMAQQKVDLAVLRATLTHTSTPKRDATVKAACIEQQAPATVHTPASSKGSHVGWKHPVLAPLDSAESFGALQTASAMPPAHPRSALLNPDTSEQEEVQVSALTSSIIPRSDILSSQRSHTPEPSPRGGTDNVADDHRTMQLESRIKVLEEQLAQLVFERHSRAASELLEKRQQSSSDMFASLQAWKRDIEGPVEERFNYTMRRVATVEYAVQRLQQRLRWLLADNSTSNGGGDEMLDGLQPSPLGATTERTAHTSEAPLASPAVRDDSEEENPTRWRGEPWMGAADATSSPSPPAIFLRRIDDRLCEWERTWRSVLEDVQEAVLSGSAPPNVSSTSPAVSGTRNELLQAVYGVLASRDADQHQRTIVEAKSHAQRTERELHDLRARLEVLEVYAPHRYAVTARPPLLGVELEDVSKPRVGVRVCAVHHGYLADRAGLSVGDMVVGVGHQFLQTRAQLYVQLGEAMRDYNAQCRLQVEMEHIRNFLRGDDNAAAAAPIGEWCGCYADGELDKGASPARSRQGKAKEERTLRSYFFHGAWRATEGENGRGDRFPVSSGTPATASSGGSQVMSSAQHKRTLAQCLPHCELRLHVVRDGRLRDVAILIPPAEALQSAGEL